MKNLLAFFWQLCFQVILLKSYTVVFHVNTLMCAETIMTGECFLQL